MNARKIFIPKAQFDSINHLFLLVSLLRQTVRSFQITLELLTLMPEAARLTRREDYAKSLETRQRTPPASATSKFELLTFHESIATIPFREADTLLLTFAKVTIVRPKFYSTVRSREA